MGECVHRILFESLELLIKRRLLTDPSYILLLNNNSSFFSSVNKFNNENLVTKFCNIAEKCHDNIIFTNRRVTCYHVEQSSNLDNVLN